MKIAILIPTIKPGGAEKQAALLATILGKEHEVHFVALYGKKDLSVIVQKFLEDANVQIHFLSGRGIWKWKEYYQLLRQYKIRIAFNYLTSCDVTGALVEKWAGVSVVYNGIRNSRLAPVKVVMEWFAHNFIADYTIYNCISGAEYFERRGFCKKKTIVIHNCFPDISEPVVHTDKAIKTIVTVGRFEPQKDYLTAIKAIAELRKRRTDFEFIIIGHGHLEEKIRTWVRNYGLSDYTKIFIAPSDVQDILKDSDIYLSTSLFEGTSNSIMEAMNWSIPVVATNVGDNYVLVDHAVSGVLTAVRDVEALSLGMERLLSSYHMRVIMGQKGNKRLQDFSIKAFKENYNELLKTQI